MADLNRDQIASGELEPGARLPSELDLMQRRDLSRNTVRQAFAPLRAEGAIVMGPRGSVVRPGKPRREVSPSGALVTARTPAEAERRQLAIGQGIPILLITTAEGEELLPADRFAVRVTATE